jgi:hypothetical protein
MTLSASILSFHENLVIEKDCPFYLNFSSKNKYALDTEKQLF